MHRGQRSWGTSLLRMKVSRNAASPSGTLGIAVPAYINYQ